MATVKNVYCSAAVCIVVALPLVIEPTIVEESVLNGSINSETLMYEL